MGATTNIQQIDIFTLGLSRLKEPIYSKETSS